MSCTDCVRGFWSFILGSLRMILFLLTLGYLVVNLAFTALLIFRSNVFASVDLTTKIAALDYLIAVGLILVAAFGIYGSFHNSIASMRIFALITAMLGLCVTFGIMKNYSKINNLDIQFRDAMKNYNWSAKPTDLNDNNLLIDVIQMTGCCGYDRYSDWPVNKPSQLIFAELPPSCCGSILDSQDRSCKFRYVVERAIPGCRGKIDKIKRMTIISGITYGLFQLLLAFIAFVVSFCNLVERPRRLVSTHYHHSCDSGRQSRVVVIKPTNMTIGNDTLVPHQKHDQAATVGPPPQYRGYQAGYSNPPLYPYLIDNHQKG